mmetsp:Transcript_3847/g.5693  ORF Transcript_3847/g.5693 Transcript_3847/m.5693 type:complete len:1314 (-) Transcript_3847:2559-6500(-)
MGAQISHISGENYSLQDLEGHTHITTPSSGNKVLKSVMCSNSKNLLVMAKIFKKRDDEQFGEPLQKERDAIRKLQESISLREQPNVLGYYRFVETNESVYLLRQYCYYSLADRIKTRPFFSQLMKKWITFQIFKGVEQLHNKNLVHGDIKKQNVLLTGWDWVFITDLAPFKPATTKPHDNLAALFGTAEKTVSLAPERISLDNDKAQGRKAPTEITQAMDVFGVGVVTTLLFTKEKDVFPLEGELIAYIQGKEKNLEVINEITNENIKNMVRTMLSINPEDRHSMTTYIKEGLQNGMFHPKFNIIHTILSHFVVMDADERIKRMKFIHEYLLTYFKTKSKPSTQEKKDLGIITEHVLKILNCKWDNHKANEYDTIIKEPDDVHKVMEKYKNKKVKDENRPCMEIISAVLCSSLRDAVYVENRIIGLNLIHFFSEYCNDDTLLQRLVPYTCFMLGDKSAMVKADAIRVLEHILLQISSTNTESNLFSDYILDKLKELQEKENKQELVLVTLAEYLPLFAMHAKTFISRAAKENKEDFLEMKIWKDTEKKITDMIQRITGNGTINQQKALITHLKKIVEFYKNAAPNGESHHNKVVQFMYAKKNSPICFRSLIENIIPIADDMPFQYLRPFIDTTLRSPEEDIIAEGIKTMKLLVERGYVSENNISDSEDIVNWAKEMAPLLHHPNIIIRYHTISYFCTAVSRLETIKTFVHIYPLLIPHMDKKFEDHQPLKLNRFDLTEMLKLPLSRDTFDKAINIPIKNWKVSETNIKKKWDARFSGEPPKFEHEYEILDLMEDYFSRAVRKKLQTTHSSVPEHQVIQEITPELQHLQPQYDRKIPDDALMNKQENSIFYRPLKNLERATKYKPNAVLKSQSHEHDGPISSIAVHDSLSWFVSSSPKFIKLWDVNKIEQEMYLVSRSNCTIENSTILGCEILALPSSTPYIACCQENGQLDVFDVITGKTIQHNQFIPNDILYFKSTSEIQSNKMDSSHVDSVNVIKSVKVSQSSVPLLMCGTDSGLLYALDTRTKQPAFILKHHLGLSEGPISALCSGDDWIVSGSRGGYLNLWDLRYQFSVGSFPDKPQHGMIRHPVTSLAVYHTENSVAPNIFVGRTNDVIEQWDVSYGNEPVKRFVCSHFDDAGEDLMDQNSLITSTSYGSTSRTFGTDEKSVRAAQKSLHPPNKLDLFSTKEFTKHISSKSHFQVGSLCVLPNQSFFSGSSDEAIRFWQSAETSRILSAPAHVNRDAVKYDEKQNMVVEHYDSLPTLRSGDRFAQPVSTSHFAEVSTLNLVSPHNSKKLYLLSGGRDGCIKVFGINQE